MIEAAILASGGLTFAGGYLLGKREGSLRSYHTGMADALEIVDAEKVDR